MKKVIKIFALILLAGGAMTAFGRPEDRMMDKFDSDGDGMISAEEFQPPRDRGMMEHMDANNDGAVTMEEINQQIADHQIKMAERQAEMTARVQEFFSNADTDGDGSVTGEEAREAAFNRIDENGDNYLTEKELRNAKPPHGGRHRPGRPGERGGA
jgi:Ca2+-binding EF-hand superfamily protein